MTAERDPIPRRAATYQGDQRDVLDNGYASLVGPDTRGIVWLPCHVDYDPGTNRSRIIYRPIADHELETVMKGTKQ